MEPGISLYQYKTLNGSSSDFQVPATAGRARPVSDAVDVTCIDVLHPLSRAVPRPLPLAVPCPRPHAVPCPLPRDFVPFALPVTAQTDGEL